MPARIPEDRHRILIGEQGLEGMARHIDEGEALGEVEVLARGMNPAHALRPLPAARDCEHAEGGIGARHLEAFGRHAHGRQAGAAAEVEHRPAGFPRQSEIELVVLPPAVEMIVEPGDGVIGIDIEGIGHAALSSMSAAAAQGPGRPKPSRQLDGHSRKPV